MFEGVDAWAVINTLITLVMVLVIVPLRSAIQKLTDSDEKLRDEIRKESGILNNRVTTLEVEVAKNYIQRAEVAGLLSDITQKLDGITHRLDNKIEALDHAKANK